MTDIVLAVIVPGTVLLAIFTLIAVMIEWIWRRLKKTVT
jgi:hypothetical protein